MNKEKNEKIEMSGKVTKTLPSTQFLVELEGGNEIRAYLAGKMMVNRISVMVGDEVIVEMSPYDLTKGRIIRRK
jgi:translation initiation factor IF-1